MAKCNCNTYEHKAHLDQRGKQTPSGCRLHNV